MRGTGEGIQILPAGGAKYYPVVLNPHCEEGNEVLEMPNFQGLRDCKVESGGMFITSAPCYIGTDEHIPIYLFF